MSLAENALLTAHRHGLVSHGLVSLKRMADFARLCIECFDVKAGGPGAAARSLSGGNLQKFIVGREILQQPKVLVVSQPTWGVDVGAAGFIRQSLIDRMLNVGTIQIESDDRSTPHLLLRGLPSPRPLFDTVKTRIIAVKRQRGVIKMDMG